MLISETIRTAIMESNIPIIKQAIKEGVLTKEARFLYNNATIWHIAVMEVAPKNIELLQEMLQIFITTNYEVLNLKDENSLTPLHFAAFYKNLAAIRLLVYFGADPTITTTRGESLTDFMKKHVNDELLKTMEKIITDYREGKKPVIKLKEITLLKEVPENENLHGNIFNKFFSKSNLHKLFFTGHDKKIPQESGKFELTLPPATMNLESKKCQ